MNFIFKYLLPFIFIGCYVTSFATHNRAGEITYRRLFGYTYEIKIVTYTNTKIIGGQSPADRCEDTLHFGDGTSAVVLRSNGTVGVLTSCAPAHDGEMITNGIKKNVYVTTHTYGGPGNYLLKMFDPNRNGGIINIPNSVNQPFYLETLLVIDNFLGGNSSPVLTFPPIDNACVNKCFLHNPGAYDPDGDSLSYEITVCKGVNGQTIPGYYLPATGAGGTLNVDAHNGDFTWCSPLLQGEYNFAMFIKEWRKNLDGEWQLMGYIYRDMQVDVGVCNNNPPQIRDITDTCVEAGTLLQIPIFAADTFPANQPDEVTLSANGGPFVCPAPNATFASTPSLGTAQGMFTWQTACVHVRTSPYQVTLKAIDNDPQIQLVDFKSFNITVVGPPPQNLVGIPTGSSINLTWTKSNCQQTTGNRVIGYYIYRKNDCTPWLHGPCETGVPAYTGFVKVGQTNDQNVVSFLDDNNGMGLSQGVNYSYLVVAFYADGSLSYASNQVCVKLKRNVPLLVNVDVTNTSATAGSVFIRWLNPLVDSQNLDTTTLSGPYEYKLMHHDNFTGTFTQVYSVSKPYFKLLNQLSDTTFTHTSIDTDTKPHTYRIDFYANGQLLGSTQTASSVFLTLTPSDNKIKLSWQHVVPWTNYKNFIYKKGPSQVSYTLIDSTTQINYTDTGLVNGLTYCYKVLTKGEYSDPTIFHPLLNFSEEECAAPIDKTPPCAPTLSIASDCEFPQVTLKWTNPNKSCSDDAVKYLLYFSPSEDEPLALIDSIKNMNDTILVFDNLTSIAGCYAITAVDSFNNESVKSTVLCVDNCPEYELPNVITINGDGVNDVFKPIKNRFIKEIELKIYNRWGTLVFETTDPKINWDGKVMQSKLQCTEGTYFYTCNVNEIRVKGIIQRSLHGYLQVFNK